ncbi:MAG: hypothetical protein ACLQG3_12200 [Terracidiphilus sp.]
MQELETRPANPELRELVVAASRALARLDAARLEELALSCQALNRDLETMDPEQRRDLERQAREAAPDLAVYARVLEATRANRNVMRRLHQLRAVRLEYSERQVRGGSKVEATHGDN